MRADEDVELPVLGARQDLFHFLVGLEARDDLDGRGRSLEALLKRLEVLLREHRGGRQHRHLPIAEISHHLLHQDEYFSLNIMSTIDYIILDEREIDGDAVHPSKDIQAEMITKFSAMEFVFPYEFREISKAEIASGKTTAFAVAAHFDIPEHIVQYALSDKYMEYAKRVWAEIH